MIFRALLTACVIAMPIVAFAQQSFTESWDGRLRARSVDLMRTTILDAHNRARDSYGSPPLVWDTTLEADALTYARRLADAGRFSHDPQIGVSVRQGENLWMGTRGAYSYSRMASTWIDERDYFKPGPFPQISRTGSWTRVGHYTQIVWPETTSVGCAIASNAQDDYLVCRYFPAGNVMGMVMR